MDEVLFVQDFPPNYWTYKWKNQVSNPCLVWLQACQYTQNNRIGPGRRQSPCHSKLRKNNEPSEGYRHIGWAQDEPRWNPLPGVYVMGQVSPIGNNLPWFHSLAHLLNNIRIIDISMCVCLPMNFNLPAGFGAARTGINVMNIIKIHIRWEKPQSL